MRTHIILYRYTVRETDSWGEKHNIISMCDINNNIMRTLSLRVLLLEKENVIKQLLYDNAGGWTTVEL